MKLWLVRHAAVDLPPGLCYGALDVAADAAATRRLAAELATVLPREALLMTSPLQRCERLAQAACGLRPDLASKRESRLAEMNFGTWEGRPWDSIGRAAVEAWTTDFAEHAPGGGESASRFLARVAEVFDECRAADRDTVWLTHAGVIRAALLLHAGVRELASAAQWPREAVPLGSWRVLEV